MWQELVNAASRVSRQALEHVLEIAVRIVSVELRGLYEAHDDRGASPPARSDPANIQFDLPRATGLMRFSIQLLAMGKLPSSR